MGTRLPLVTLKKENITFKAATFISIDLAWTPKRWFDSIQAQGAPAGAKSEEAGNGNEASEDQLPPIPANLQDTFDRHLAKMTQRKEERTLIFRQLGASS
eukprot:s355_g8.t1